MEIPEIESKLENMSFDSIVKSYCNKVNEIERLKKELKVTDELLEDRNRLLDVIPECESHGKCIPHAIDWVKEQLKNK